MNDTLTIATQTVEAQSASTVAALRRGPTGLKVLQIAADALRRASRVAQSSPDLPRVACRAGCSACCHVAVSITAPEALLIADRLRRRLEPDALDALRPRIDDTSRRVSHLTIEARARARVACALLGTQGECTIHADRPLGCRGWTSFSRAACDAALAAFEPGHSGPMDRLGLAAASAVTEGLERGLHACGLDGKHYELHSALSRALHTASAAERWVQGEDVFSKCARVTSGRLTGSADFFVPAGPACTI